MTNDLLPDADGVIADWTAELARHQCWLRTVVIARCGEPQAADEIMQEIAMAAWKQQAPLKDAEKVAPWLYQVAVRQSLMYRRRHGRRRIREQRYAETMETNALRPTPPNPLEWLIARERQKLIRQGIARLRPKEAEILLLKYIEGWSYGQIADHLGISPNAVESRLHRARQRLRREMVTLNVIEAR